MILNEKCNITAPSKSKYKITDIFKNTDGSIGTYQVELSRQPGKTYTVLLDASEFEAVSNNIDAAYFYIEQYSRGIELYSFRASYGAKEFFDDMCKIKKDFEYVLNPFFKEYREISIKEYCNQIYMYPYGFNIGPRYVMMHSHPLTITNSFWFDELYGTEIAIPPIDSYKQYVMIINGLLWMDNETINMRRSSNDRDFLEFIINKYNEAYKSAYKESFHIFLSRFNAFRESLNKEDDKDGNN
jgi:hypothetical protein